MADIFEKWNSNVDLAGLQQDIKDAQENKREYDEIPHGEYEVKVDKMELKATKTDKQPMVSIQFRIISGKYKNSCLFFNKKIGGTKNDGLMIHQSNEFLRSMGTDLAIEFVDYKQYAELLLDVAEECDTNNLEFALKYEDNKGYDKFTITEVFEG